MTRRKKLIAAVATVAALVLTAPSAWAARSLKASHSINGNGHRVMTRCPFPLSGGQPHDPSRAPLRGVPRNTFLGPLAALSPLE